MVEGDTIELKRAPGTCCPEPECDKVSGQMGLAGCLGCEYLGICRDDPQKVDYCPRPRTCSGCGADCTKCALWSAPIINWDFSKMTEGEALYSLGIRAIERDGKKGINIPIPGKPGESLFIPASDEEPGAIIASDRKQDQVKGAKKTRCADCRRKVWISPSTQEMLRRYPGTPVICMACFVKRVEKEKKQEKEA
ncbi:hypothetical protein ES703_18421 [subsurface metagenome]